MLPMVSFFVVFMLEIFLNMGFCLLIFCFEKNRSNAEPVKPKSIYVIQYGWV